VLETQEGAKRMASYKYPNMSVKLGDFKLNVKVCQSVHLYLS
jgi:hypothetical protein